ncbi:hypothetical protein MLD38_039003 [Melastoma candidum]|uniref:Uncharacterized protein n=1 Tax=Melastoma candidum TaxID=119954 RepID=A0ACB9L1E0_9MYRT|nr:hypothetical protein MLD38_039003 [Melastoma candidum]
MHLTKSFGGLQKLADEFIHCHRDYQLVAAQVDGSTLSAEAVATSQTSGVAVSDVKDRRTTSHGKAARPSRCTSTIFLTDNHNTITDSLPSLCIC